MALTHHIDIERHKQFKKDVDNLLKFSYIRRYTADISKKTKASTGNISNYYNGKRPISDNFLKIFRHKFKYALKQILEGNKDLTEIEHVPSNIVIPQAQNDNQEHLQHITKSGSVSDVEQHYPSHFERIILEKLISIEQTIKTLEQKINDQPKPPRKKPQ